MNENKIKAGVIGLGLIGPCHIEAIRRTGFADVKACADLDTQLANKKAQQDSIPLVYNNIDEMIADPDIMVIHNCTPNYLHKEINGKVIRSGKHLFSEKPLARSASESQVLLDLLNDFPQTVAAVNFNYRMNPLVQEMRVNIANGEIGKPRIIHGSYL
jgi:predicted dehydrogenase